MVDHSAIRRCMHVLVALIVVQALACRGRKEADSIEQRFAALRKADRVARSLPDRAKAAVIGAAYDDLFASVRSNQTLDSITSPDLEVLYRAASLAGVQTLDERHIRDMESFLKGLQDRGSASKTHYVHMYEAFIRARMLREAGAFARLHPMPELEALPELREAADLVADQPTEWAVDADKRELLRRSVDLHQPAMVVIVSHPLCHFSQDAMRDIQNDPLLREVLGAHARWLAPPDGRINFDIVQQWNREHPGWNTTLTFRRDEWPMIDSWNTPTFYFFKNGAVIAKVEGWPREGRRSELIAALRQVGLLP